MTVSVKIVGVINVGTGISFHSDYKLEVCLNESRWIVYRRYKAFEYLHEKLLSLLGEEEFTINFLEKQYMGSYLSTLKAFTDDRIAKLQQYLDAIFLLDNVVDSQPVKDFLDFDYRGTSGVVRELGEDKVLREAFLQARATKSLPPALGIWCTRYVALLSSGSIIVLASPYDDSTRSIVRMALVNGQTSVIPQASNNSIHITSTLDKTKLSIAFPSAADSVFWLRKLSDFVLNTEFSEDHQRDVAAQKKDAAARELAQQEAFAAANTEHIHSRGTGRTQDELSATLGI